MAPVGRIGPATLAGSGRTSRRAPAAAAGAISAPSALVEVASARPATGVSPRAAGGRPTAPFLAHLIATVQDAPQTRERRRADPDCATAAYGALMQVPASIGRTVRESR